MMMDMDQIWKYKFRVLHLTGFSPWITSALSPLLVGLIAMGVELVVLGLCTSQWTDNKKGSSRNVSNGPQQFIPLCGFLFASHSLTGEEGRNGGITAALLLRTYFTASLLLMADGGSWR